MKQIFKDLEELRECELSRDLEQAKKIFLKRKLWTDIETDPDVSNFEPPVQAELLRFCGFYLSWYGRSYNGVAYQGRGKNILTRASELFEQLGYSDKVAESQVLLAYCYWYEGEVEECEAILDYTLEQFKNNQLHPVYLQIHINRMLTMHYKENIQDAIKLIEDLKILIELCPDLRLKTMYYNHAGIFYTRLKRYDLALFNQNQAIYFARKLKSRRYVAINLNNLAYLNLHIEDYVTALRQVEESLELFTELFDEGWIPHVFDTKALILDKLEKIPESLEAVEEAIRRFQTGEDYSGLAESMWTKMRIQIRAGLKTEALELFADLIALVRRRIGYSAVEKYSKRMADLVFLSDQSAFTEEVKRFKRDLISRALINNDFSVMDASRDLQISHQMLSEILRNQFPDLREKFGLSERAGRRRKIPLKKERVDKIGAAPKTLKINQIDLSIFDLRFDDTNIDDEDKIFAFFVPGENLAQFEIGGSAVIAVLASEFCPDAPFMIFLRGDGGYKFGIAGYDKILEFYYLIDETGEPLPLVSTEFIAVGKIIGFCLEKDINENEIVFEPLRI